MVAFILRDLSSVGYLEGRTRGADVLFTILLERQELEEDMNVERARRETFSPPRPVYTAACVAPFNPPNVVLEALGRPGARCHQTSVEESSFESPSARNDAAQAGRTKSLEFGTLDEWSSEWGEGSTGP